jgi:hypothetical protein
MNISRAGNSTLCKTIDAQIAVSFERLDSDAFPCAVIPATGSSATPTIRLFAEIGVAAAVAITAQTWASWL